MEKKFKYHHDLVDAAVIAKRMEDEKYKDSVAIGYLKATLTIALQCIEEFVDAYEHSPEEAAMHARYATSTAKIIFKSIEELADVHS